MGHKPNLYSLAVGMSGTNVSLGAGCCRCTGGQSTARTFKCNTGCLAEAARIEGQLGHLVNDRHDCLLQAKVASESLLRGAWTAKTRGMRCRVARNRKRKGVDSRM